MGLSTGVSLATDNKIDQATKFLKDACVTSGSSFEVRASVRGAFEVRRILGSGAIGSVTLTKKELQGFADAASALSAQQATEMRNCMKPHIDKEETFALPPLGMLHQLVRGIHSPEDEAAVIMAWRLREDLDNMIAEHRVIGAALEDFNKHWARRVLGQNATVLLFTDG